MSDIFISYSSLDRDRIRPIIQAFENHGWSVWWDQKITHGNAFDEIIENELKITKCVVVFWSKNSVLASWVRAEAHKGMERGVLVPVVIDEVEIPLRFNIIQSAKLLNLKDSSSISELERLIESINELFVETEKASKTVEKNKLTAKVPDPFARPLWVGALMGLLTWLFVYFSPDSFGQLATSSFPAMCGFAATYHYVKYMPVPVSYTKAFKISLMAELSLFSSCLSLQTIFKAEQMYFQQGIPINFKIGMACFTGTIIGSILSIKINKSVKGY
ncbi:MAG TPA: toll/interleukin-1 receptor domain-containing protein [Pyrinomonadaceae bacterium]|jgi:hypothetical protein